LSETIAAERRVTETVR